MPPRRADRDGAIRALSERLGVETRYRDQSGAWHDVPVDTLRGLCRTLAGLDDSRNAGDLLADFAKQGDADVLAHTVVVRPGARHLDLRLRRLASAGRVRWRLQEENGAVHDGSGATVRINRPPATGYHRLDIEWSGRQRGAATATLITVPARAYLPPAMAKARVWGLASQLYALRSPRNWGVGNFSDLGTLINRAAALGADVVGVNPLHALFPDDPQRASPYSPSSRLFVNPLYLDLEAVEDFAECEPARRLVASRAFEAARRKARDQPLVDYAQVTELKRRVGQLLYDSFRSRHLKRADDARAAEFRAFQARGGEPLRRFATFHALREVFARQGRARAWPDWRREFRDPRAAAVKDFTRRHLNDIEAIEYLQWQVDRQLARAAGTARALGMAVGLYQDLAVGFDPGGADAWALQDMVAAGWNIGAPPDAWSPKGQDWGLAPLNPRQLRAAAYSPIVETLRANMRHAGALRIDHVLGLQRFFWVPHGGSPADGAYVRYPFEDLLGIVALESVRQRCIVIGEDLGTVPAGFSRTLQRHGVLSYRLLYFSRTAKGGFETPRQYPADALAAISTHDLPTLAGYWRGDDIALRQRLRLFPERGQAARDRKARDRDRRALLAAFRTERLPVRPGEVPVDAAHRFLARSRARIVMAQIEDLAGLREQANLPGTIDEHPNWRRKLPRDIDALLAEPAVRERAAALAHERPKAEEAAGAAASIPRATYRLQLNSGFTFADAAAAVPYLARLGVSHLYLSPIFEAQKDSTHGYDTTSFDRLNPDLGGEEGFAQLAAEARAHGLQILLDFVPNHMGVGQARNDWWLDLLEWGPRSPAAPIFDVDWAPAAWPELRGKLTVPLLGDAPEKLAARGEIALRFDAERGSFALWYHAHCFPVRPADYAIILEPLARRRGAAMARLANAFARLATQRDAYRRGPRLKVELARWAAADHGHRRAVEGAARNVVGPPLMDLLGRQNYRLAFWRTAGRQINYRRFFDINQLASLRMEQPKVFERCHRTIGHLVTENLIQGIRLDHVDGLYDPGEYCRQLRTFVRHRRAARAVRAPSFYVAVEKILAADEELRRDWPVQGTTGYEFANWVNGVLVEPAGAAALDRVYRRFTGRALDFAAELRAAKRQVVEELFGGEMTALVARLTRLDGAGRFEVAALRTALQDIVVEFPLYRSYVGQRGASAEDRRIIGRAVKAAQRHGHSRDATILRFLRSVLTAEFAARRPANAREVRDIAVRVQQLTAPVQAKALEDTAFYRFTRLISLNEVGGDPGRVGMPAAEFHGRLRRQASDWPHTLLATATHDTKRGEDARARISVLSEIPDRWARHVARWQDLNRRALGTAAGERAPSPNDEYLLYQALVGAWPMELVGASRFDAAVLDALRERLNGYFQKAVREAKLSSSWVAPNEAYEAACRVFVDRLLDPRGSARFLDDFGAFTGEVARCGALNSLTQTVLKLMAPGVPDIYRGCELWDLSLVDPDNRRPISLDERHRHIDDLAAQGRHVDVRRLAADWRSGRIKLFVTARLLALRRALPALFAHGSYEPLRVTGGAARHVLAFRRRHDRDTVIVAVGRTFASFAAARGTFTPRTDAWRDTYIMGGGAPPDARNVLAGSTVGAETAERLSVESLFDELPFAVISAAPL